MNAPIIDPLQGDFPEVIEEYLEHSVMKCIAFNRRGTLLAAGCSNGSCVIWDFETRGIAKELYDKGCASAITSVCWSKNGHHLLASAANKSLTLWNVLTGEKVARTTLHQTTLHARLHPGSSKTSICLACPLSSPPVIVDLSTGSITVLPISVSDPVSATALSQSRNKFTDGSAPFVPTAATFNKHGDLIYVASFKGEILIVDYQSNQLHGVISVSGGSAIKNIVFSRDGQYLVTNSNDRTIRVYENLLPQKNAVKALVGLIENLDSDLEGIEKLKMVGSKCLVLSREFQDSVNRSQWKAPCFSRDGDWVIGALASKGEHKIYIWGKDGNLVKILEGPKEALTDLAWHPVKPIIVSVSIAGLVYIWAKDRTENWSAFAPDFKELEENEEYEEREDEFDLMPEIEKVKETDINEDDEVDIITVENESRFSDSDMSEDELCFLPSIPSPDVIEEPDKCVESFAKVEESAQSETPDSDEVVQNGGLDINPESSACGGITVANSVVEEVATNGRVKRNRKPSEKGLELQSELQSEWRLEKGKKSSTKKKTYTKVTKKKRRIESNENGANPTDDEWNSMT